MAAASAQVASTAPWKTLLQRSLSQNASLPYSKYMQLATVRTDGRPANRTVVFRGFLDGTDDLTFVTDQRSRKVTELAANPHGEVCWYFPNTREQYRISGPLQVVGAGPASSSSRGGHLQEQQPEQAGQQQQQPEQQPRKQQQRQQPDLQEARLAAWGRMSTAGRAQFSWPSPRQPRIPADEALFLQPADPSEDQGQATPPDAFCLVVMSVEEVDLVDLYANTRMLFSRGAHQDGSNGTPTAVAAAAEPSWQSVTVNP